MISQKISHYQIVDKIGAGGMGEVYLAEDTRLGRQVALKLLPSSYQYDLELRERFLREARAASALRTPNAAAIYDIGEHEGSIFIVMEYIEGDLLSSKLERGPLPVREVIEVALQIADAFNEAHALGIVHRDIKSSNLIVTKRGLVKILDFGVAKVAESQGEEDDRDRTMKVGQQTSPGVVLGTVSYLSPEQALARSVDHRSDIFSLGVVMYEMLTARLPFEGDSPTEVIDRILHQEPPAIARFNYDVPAELERIVRKCLEKDVERRYQSAEELIIDLRTLERESDSKATTAPGPKRQTTRRLRSRRTIDSLAILPLANVNSDVEMEYLSDGITESIINNMSQLPKLRVMARSTVFRYKGRDITPQDVGRDLNVRAVMTGRVLQRGDTLVIKAELVDAIDGSQLWGEQYNRKLADIFAIEEEISKEISDKLRLKLSGEQKRRLTRRHTKNTAAYQLYLKGRYHLNKRTEEDLKKGIEHFHAAACKDPSYSLAYAGLADAYILITGYSSMLPEEAYPVAKAAAVKALKLDETLAEAHTSLAAVRLWYEWDYLGAERRFKRALELNPGYSTTHLWYALDLAAMGRMEEALAMIKRAQELDPLSLIINLNGARILYFARRYDESIDQCLKVIDIDPGFSLAHRRLGQAYAQNLMYEEAFREFRRALAISENDTETMSVMGFAYAASGDKDEARNILDRVNELSKQTYVSPYSLARLYLGLGETDRAFEFLEIGYEQRIGILAYLGVEPVFDSLRSDPRFTGLLERLGLAL